MRHPIYRVTSFEQTGPYSLRVQFDDGSSQTIDFESVLAGELYSPLRDLAEFARVKIDPEVNTLIWPSGADFDPAILMIGLSMKQHPEQQHNAGAMR